jgi:hypothetical protein
VTPTAGWRSRARTKALVGEDDADARLIAAYRSVFAEGREDVEIVLADMAEHTGFYKVAERGADSDIMIYDEGRRSAFARVWSFLTLTDAQLAALESAARNESA